MGEKKLQFRVGKYEMRLPDSIKKLHWVFKIGLSILIVGLPFYARAYYNDFLVQESLKFSQNYHGLKLRNTLSGHQFFIDNQGKKNLITNGGEVAFTGEFDQISESNDNFVLENQGKKFIISSSGKLERPMSYRALSEDGILTSQFGGYMFVSPDGKGYIPIDYEFNSVARPGESTDNEKPNYCIPVNPETGVIINDLLRGFKQAGNNLKAHPKSKDIDCNDIPSFREVMIRRWYTIFQ